MTASRRSFLATGGSLALAPLLPACGDGEETGLPSTSVFQHGVASGDPLTDAVVLWTRVTPEAGATTVAVSWAIATDPDLAEIVQEGTFETDEGRDFTVKVDVTGLPAGTTFYYRFDALGEASPVGRTRTAGDGALDRLRFAVVSCSNYPYGFFNAYAKIAARADLDAVIHLGDYLYEYAAGEYSDQGIDRAVVPEHEIVTLEDYRARHALYKTDPDLREAHRQHPFIPVWDDHELANNAWSGGAGNHDESEGDYQVRKAVARQAYFEWMPIRGTTSDGSDRIYRSFAFGDLVDLLMLDTRIEGRDLPPEEGCDQELLNDPERQLLGAEQEAWFLSELVASQERGTRWRLIGQQVMVGQLHNPGVSRPCALNLDQWDGYGATRTRFFDAIEEGAIENVVVLTGDIHSSWAIELSRDPFDAAVYDPATGSGSLAVELVTPAVTSPGIDDPVTATTVAEGTLNSHPHVKYVDLFYRGYLLVDVTREALHAEWYHVDSIVVRGAAENLAASYRVAGGKPYLVAAPEPTRERDDAPPRAP